MADGDVITFGAVHLKVRDPERTARFWEDLFGFQRRASDGNSIAVGTADETLLILHGGRAFLSRRGIAACITLRYTRRTPGILRESLSA